MAGSRLRQRGVNLDVWPGFVDALATILIVMVFVLMIFFISQIYLSDVIDSKQKGMDSLQTKLQEVSSLLHVERTRNDKLSESFRLTSQQLSDLQLMKTQLEADHALQIEARERKILDTEQYLAEIQTKVELLNEQLQKLNDALNVSETTNQDQKLKLEELDKRLASVMIQKLEELEKYRSEFFGKLKEVLANRSDIRIVGDRFVFQSEVLFPTASATIGKEGEAQLVQLAKTLKDISKTMPKDMQWVLRVDGHTDSRPIKTDKYPSNWELSTARAISVVNFLKNHGISPKNLAATGFGEHHPIEEKRDDEKNRRIEFKLDQR